MSQVDTISIIQELSARRKQLLFYADSLEATIKFLSDPFHENSTTAPFKDKLKSYEKAKGELSDTSVDGRIFSILKKAGRFMFRNEIENVAASEGRPFKTGIATALSYAKKQQKNGLVMLKIGHNKVVWGFEEWLEDLTGEIKAANMYKTTQHSML